MHAMNKRPVEKSIPWMCVGSIYFDTCFTGITNVFQARGIECWACEECKFSICKKCI